LGKGNGLEGGRGESFSAGIVSSGQGAGAKDRGGT
jgi:hypothetical protein